MTTRHFRVRRSKTRGEVLSTFKKLTGLNVEIQDENTITVGADRVRVGVFEEAKVGEPIRFSIEVDGSMTSVRFSRAALTFCREV